MLEINEYILVRANPCGGMRIHEHNTHPGSLGRDTQGRGAPLLSHLRFPDPAIPSPPVSFSQWSLYLPVSYTTKASSLFHVVFVIFPLLTTRTRPPPPCSICLSTKLFGFCPVSSSSPSEKREIQYELLSLLQGQAERKNETDRKR